PTQPAYLQAALASASRVAVTGYFGEASMRIGDCGTKTVSGELRAPTLARPKPQIPPGAAAAHQLIADGSRVDIYFGHSITFRATTTRHVREAGHQPDQR